MLPIKKSLFNAKLNNIVIPGFEGWRGWFVPASGTLSNKVWRRLMRQLLKGNHAVVKGAIAAGCKAYFGYPITPASEIAEAASELFPESGGIFIPAESEIGSIQMLFGAAAAGVRAMTASSGPGLSLMQEGISYMAGGELPGCFSPSRGIP